MFTIPLYIESGRNQFSPALLRPIADRKESAKKITSAYGAKNPRAIESYEVPARVILGHTDFLKHNPQNAWNPIAYEPTTLGELQSENPNFFGDIAQKVLTPLFSPGEVYAPDTENAEYMASLTLEHLVPPKNFRLLVSPRLKFSELATTLVCPAASYIQALQLNKSSTFERPVGYHPSGLTLRSVTVKPVRGTIIRNQTHMSLESGATKFACVHPDITTVLTPMSYDQIQVRSSDMIPQFDIQYNFDVLFGSQWRVKK